MALQTIQQSNVCVEPIQVEDSRQLNVETFAQRLLCSSFKPCSFHRRALLRTIRYGKQTWSFGVAAEEPLLGLETSE